MKVYHIIVAAGSGNRFGASVPKQFCDLDGRPVLMETVERMRLYGHAEDIVLVISREMEEEWLKMCHEHGFSSPRLAYGGATRWESVRNALAHVPLDADVITVHDGARPLVTQRLIDNVIDAVASGAPGALPAVQVSDSLRELDDVGDGSRPVDRSRFRAVQTPQGFRADVLRCAYRLPFSPMFTDDASVVEASGCTGLVLVEGDIRNLKITYPHDIEIARMYMGR